jgi:hypothetical protein
MVQVPRGALEALIDFATNAAPLTLGAAKAITTLNEQLAPLQDFKVAIQYETHKGRNGSVELLVEARSAQHAIEKGKTLLMNNRQRRASAVKQASAAIYN